MCFSDCRTASAVPWNQPGLSGVCSAASISTKPLLNKLNWYVFFICLFSDAELYCVSTNMRLMLLLMQFEMGISTSLYLPAIGTAGLLLVAVKGYSLLPAPPPKITATTCLLVIIIIYK